MDRLTPERRSWLMSRVKGKNTRPELVVRSTAHRLGYRFRLHLRDLPGKPDLVFSARRKVVFVNGCFWHGHRCKIEKMPKSRIEYWSQKISQNRARDARHIKALRASGWRCLIIWECETRDTTQLAAQLRAFLGQAKQTASRVMS
ncbi:very short patch repair endonuclease [Paraburkholderia bannensis]|uniref:very short patch repair endonuclease n=1 Tax=Paraburkholderia bannensis TaxID=765414 RepID=UPI002ABDD22F|nr:very short patch repair endonuclease [Paraburkholderia bannensis]